MPAPRPSHKMQVDDSSFAVKRRKAIPHEFVLEAIAGLTPETRPMFGCLAVYVGTLASKLTI